MSADVRSLTCGFALYLTGQTYRLASTGRSNCEGFETQSKIFTDPY